MDDIVGPGTVTTSIKKKLDSKKTFEIKKDIGMV